MLLESGKLIGRPNTLLARGFGVVEKAGQTEFWKNIYGWSTGELVRVTALPLKKEIFYKGSRTGVTEDGITIYGRHAIYKGWGYPEWVPRGVAEQTKIGTEAFHAHRFIESTVGHGREQIFRVDVVSRPKGHLWWKSITERTATAREFDPFILESTKRGLSTADVWEGWVRPGYTIPAEYPYTVVTKGISKVQPKFLANVEASATLVPPTTIVRPLRHAIARTPGYIGGSLAIPASSFAPSLSILYALRPLISTKQAQIPEIKLATELKTGVFSMSLLEQKLLPKLEEIEKPAFTTIQGDIRVATPIEEEMQLSLQEQMQLQLSLQEQKQLQVLEQEQLSMYDYASRYSMRQPERGKHIAPRIKFGMMLPTGFGEETGTIEETKGQAAYNVLVKDRYIYHGKPTGEEKFIRMNEDPLSRIDALALGAHLTDESAAATFKIEETTGKIRPLEHDIMSWNMRRHKFYQKPDKTFIEKTIHRIDTPGEKEDITAQGLKALMEQGRKQVKQVRSMIEREPLRQVREPKRARDMDRYEMPDSRKTMDNVNRELNKVLRRGM